MPNYVTLCKLMQAGGGGGGKQEEAELYMTPSEVGVFRLFTGTCRCRVHCAGAAQGLQWPGLEITADPPCPPAVGPSTRTITSSATRTQPHLQCHTDTARALTLPHPLQRGTDALRPQAPQSHQNNDTKTDTTPFWPPNGTPLMTGRRVQYVPMD